MNFFEDLHEHVVQSLKQILKASTQSLLSRIDPEGEYRHQLLTTTERLRAVALQTPKGQTAAVINLQIFGLSAAAVVESLSPHLCIVSHWPRVRRERPRLRVRQLRRVLEVALYRAPERLH